ncbi:MAG: hypothetical protein NTW32_22830 [Chloroflexi bacterium]|nr:hypothetical protein [Chloroflexota bacterium]
MLEIPIFVTSVWTGIRSVLPIIAAKGAEEIGKLAVSEIWGAIKKEI